MLSDAVLSRLQRLNDRALMDRCQILTYSAGEANGYGLPSPSYSEGDEINCLFRGPRQAEGMDASQVPMSDARIRLALGTEITAADRVRLTALHGETLAPAEDYEIIGNPRSTYTGIVLNLKLVTTG